jgi:hypothetical protein
MKYLGEKAQIKVLFTLGASTSSSLPAQSGNFVNHSPKRTQKLPQGLQNLDDWFAVEFHGSTSRLCTSNWETLNLNPVCKITAMSPSHHKDVPNLKLQRFSTLLIITII